TVGCDRYPTRGRKRRMGFAQAYVWHPDTPKPCFPRASHSAQKSHRACCRYVAATLHRARVLLGIWRDEMGRRESDQTHQIEDKVAFRKGFFGPSTFGSTP